jgi:acetate kinase
MMGTRCGDIDPSIPIYMQKTLGLTVDETNDVLNKKSGMIGLSAISNDMLDIENKILKENNQDAITAHDVYAYRIKKYIGAYTAAMNGLDVLIFTGGVGENMPILRELVCRDMDYLGIKLNEEENAKFQGGILDLTGENSRVKVLKVQTNEEMAIALETKRILFDEKK